MNSTVTHGSITGYNRDSAGGLFQMQGQIKIESINFSRCVCDEGPAILCYEVSNLVNACCCFIDSCLARNSVTIRFTSTSAHLIKSNIRNNTQMSSSAGVVCISGDSNCRLDIEDCIFKGNCQDGIGAYFSTYGEASIYIN